MKPSALKMVDTNNINKDHGSANTSTPSLPNLSKDAFHGPLGAIAQELVCETPPAVLLALAHATTGALFDPMPTVRMGATMHAPRFNLVLVDQDRSTFRTACDLILDFMIEADPTFQDCISHTFAAATKKKDAAAATQQDPRRLVILHGLESLGEHAGQIAHTFYPPSPSNPVSNSQAAFITMLERSHLLDLDELDAFARSYGHYYIWLSSRRAGVVPRPSPLDDDRKAEFSELVRKIKGYMAAMEGIGFRFSFTSEAADLWAEIYRELSTPTPGLLGLVVSHADLHVLRLAANYARCDCATTINATHLRAAYALWQFSATSAAEIFAGRGVDDLQNRILTHLRTEGRRLKKSDLSKRLSHHKKSHELDRALLALQHAGLIYLERRPTDGRSATDICLKVR